MKNSKLYALALGAMLLPLAGCSNEDGVVDNNDNKGTTDRYFISLNVEVPTEKTQRTPTQQDDGTSGQTVTATTAESAISDATLYICDGNAVVFSLLTTNNEGTLTANVTEKIDDLVTSVQTASGSSKEFSLFVVVNETASGISHNMGKSTESKKAADKATFSFTEWKAPIGASNTQGKSMPMGNIDALTISFDKGSTTAETKDNIISKFTVKKNDGNYYPVNNESSKLAVERAVARIEYKDADNRPEVDGDLPKEAHTFFIGTTANGNKSAVKVKAVEMKPYNVNKEAYLFRHYAAGTTDGATGAATIFGHEYGTTGYNWIPSPDWVSNSSLPTTRSFLNAISKGTDSYIIAEDGQNWVSVPSESNTKYVPWMYVTENTMPTVALMTGAENQLKYATGVAFKFVVMDSTGESELSYSAERTNYPAGVINAVGETNESITITLPDNKWMNIKPEGGKYYLTYVATIVHNDAEFETTLPAMYYGVVRNNSYQMRIKSIGGLPFPNDAQSMFLDVVVEVKDWVKREHGYDL